MVAFNARLLVWGSLASLAAARLSNSPDSGSGKVRSLFTDKNNLICGGSKIRGLLTDDASVSGARLTRWSEIMAIAETYVTDVSKDIAKLSEEAARLKAEIPKAESAGAPKMMTDSAATALVTETLVSVFNGKVENAVKMKCGFEGFRMRKETGVQKKSFDVAKTDFVERAGKLFTGQLRASGATVRDVCFKILGMGAEDDLTETYCDELCTFFSIETQGLSDTTAGAYAGSSADDLRKELQGILDKLAYLTSEKDECLAARDALKSFMLQLEDLRKDIDVKFDKRLQAQTDLDEAEDALELMEDDAKEKEATLAQAVEALGKATEMTEKVRGLEDAAKAAATDATTKADAAKSALISARQDLGKAMEAAIALQEIKVKVVESMLRMRTYFAMAIVEPMHTLNIDKETQMEDFFMTDGGPATQDGTKVRGNLEGLRKYCDTEALPAFRRVQSTVNLEPLCDFPDVAEISEQVKEQVATRRKDVIKLLKHAQSWLDVYQGQDSMTAEEAAKMVAAGEPEGLREIISVFGQSSYYTSYLQYWKVGAQPSFIKMLEQMESVLGSLGQKAEELTQIEAQLTEAKKLAIERRVVAKGLLATAIKRQDIAADKQKEAEALLAAQQAAIAGAESDLEKLEAALRAAKKAYMDARTLLAETHREGTGFLQVMRRDVKGHLA